jgi:hypothetical protein
MPRAFWYRELLYSTVGLVSAGLCSSANDAGLDECGYILTHLGPVVVATEEFKSLRLSRVPRERVIMTTLEYARTEIFMVGYENDTFMEEET